MSDETEWPHSLAETMRTIVARNREQRDRSTSQLNVLITDAIETEPHDQRNTIDQLIDDILGSVSLPSLDQ